MALVIGVPREIAPGEKRVAVVPDVVRKFRSLGADVSIERGAGAACHFRDEDFGATSIAASSGDVFGQSQVVLKVRPPTIDEIMAMPRGSVLIGFLHPYEAFGAAKIRNFYSQGANLWFYDARWMPVAERRICIAWNASAATSISLVVNILGWAEDAQT